MALAPAAVKAAQKAARAASKSDEFVMINLVRYDKAVASDIKDMLVASGRWLYDGVLDKKHLFEKFTQSQSELYQSRLGYRRHRVRA